MDTSNPEAQAVLDALNDDEGAAPADGSKFREEAAKVESQRQASEAARSTAMPPKPAKLLARGTWVIVDGLVAKPEFNGKLGQVLGYVEEKGRYKVKMDGDIGSLSLKPDNVTVTEAPKRSAGKQVQGRSSAGPQAGFKPPDHMLEEFEDQQKKLTNAAIHLENLEEKMARLVRDARRTELTKGEVAKAADDTVMYSQYGRCFIQQSKEDLQAELDGTSVKVEAQLKKTTDSQNYYERQRSETSGNLQEMLKNLQQMAERHGQ